MFFFHFFLCGEVGFLQIISVIFKVITRVKGGGEGANDIFSRSEKREHGSERVEREQEIVLVTFRILTLAVLVRVLGGGNTEGVSKSLVERGTLCSPVCVSLSEVVTVLCVLVYETSTGFPW